MNVLPGGGNNTNGGRRRGGGDHPAALVENENQHSTECTARGQFLADIDRRLEDIIQARAAVAHLLPQQQQPQRRRNRGARPTYRRGGLHHLPAAARPRTSVTGLLQETMKSLSPRECVLLFFILMSTALNSYNHFWHVPALLDREHYNAQDEINDIQSQMDNIQSQRDISNAFLENAAFLLNEKGLCLEETSYLQAVANAKRPGTALQEEETEIIIVPHWMSPTMSTSTTPVSSPVLNDEDEDDNIYDYDDTMHYYHRSYIMNSFDEFLDRFYYAYLVSDPNIWTFLINSAAIALFMFMAYHWSRNETIRKDYPWLKQHYDTLRYWAEDALDAMDQFCLDERNYKDTITDQNGTITNLRATETRHLNTITERDNTIVERDNTVATQQRTLDNHQTMLADRNTRLETAEGTITTLRAQVTSLEQTVQQRDDTIEERDEEIRSLQETVQEGNDALDEQEEEILALQGTVHERDEEVRVLQETVQECNSTLNDRNEEIRTLQDTVQERDSTLDARNEEIQTLQGRVQEQDDLLTECNGQVTSLQRTVRESNDRVAALERTVQEHEGRHAQNASQLSSLKENRKQMCGVLALFANQIDSLEHNLEAKEGMLIEANKKSADLQDTVDDLEGRLADRDTTIQNRDATIVQTRDALARQEMSANVLVLLYHSGFLNEGVTNVEVGETNVEVGETNVGETNVGEANVEAEEQRNDEEPNDEEPNVEVEEEETTVEEQNDEAINNDAQVVVHNGAQVVVHNGAGDNNADIVNKMEMIGELVESNYGWKENYLDNEEGLEVPYREVRQFISAALRNEVLFYQLFPDECINGTNEILDFFLFDRDPDAEPSIQAKRGIVWRETLNDVLERCEGRDNLFLPDALPDEADRTPEDHALLAFWEELNTAFEEDEQNGNNDNERVLNLLRAGQPFELDVEDRMDTLGVIRFGTARRQTYQPINP